MRNKAIKSFRISRYIYGSATSPDWGYRNWKLEIGNWKMGVWHGGAVKDSWDARPHETEANLEGNKAKKC